MTVSPLGDSAVVISLGESLDPTVIPRVCAVAAELERRRPAGAVDIVPAFASVAVYFDSPPTNLDHVCEQVRAIAAGVEESGSTDTVRTVEVPVCYGGEAGEDLERVAERAGLTPAAVIALHSGAEYRVHAIGFVPGFPYLGGLPDALHTPRRATPRPRVPAGSVGIGGAQTGIYPVSTPGGWNLIGRTPLALFDVHRPEPALLRMGDRVRFRPITPEELGGLRPVEKTRETAPTGGPGLHVVRAGMFTTVQDLGRTGHRAEGVPLSGAADALALRLANLLVGNPETAAGLEFTLIGPELEFAHDSIVALAGGQPGDLPCWQPFVVRSGTRLKVGPLRNGCRGYLAVAGGIEVPPVLGSRSTYVRAGFGGLSGRRLRDGDTLPVPATERTLAGHWHIDERILPAYTEAPTLRIVPGAQAGDFDPGWMDGEFEVRSQSDRMGVRLAGSPLIRRNARELTSAPVAPGTVQVPPDGQPIVLLADAQTIGGYPQVAHVIAFDLPLMAQVKPGGRVRFRLVPHAEAQRLALVREHALALLREGLKEKWA